MFDRLRRTPTAQPVKRSRPRFKNGQLNIPELKFSGQGALSQDGRWGLGWRGGTVAPPEGEPAEGFNGEVVLYDFWTAKVAAVTRKVETPVAGVIGNSGAFVIHDHHFGKQGGHTLYAFRRDGEVIVKRRFNAPLYGRIGMSEDGNFAATQALHADAQSDSQRLEVYNLHKPHRVFSVTVSTPPAETYEFEVEGEVLRKVWMLAPDVGYIAYDINGRMLETAEVQSAPTTQANPNASMKSGDIHNDFEALCEMAIVLLKTNHADEASANALQAGRRAFELAPADDRARIVKALLIQAVANERLGDLREALAVYQVALELSARPDLQQKVIELNQKLTPSDPSDHLSTSSA